MKTLPARVLFFLLAVIPILVRAQTLNLPPRPANAPTGSEFVDIIRPLSLSLTDRENMIYQQVAQGNIPNWMRNLVLVSTNAVINSVNHTVSYYVTPDYLAVGSDNDYFLEPTTPLLAQRLADLLNCSLPTRKMVNDIWKKAPCHLAPSSIAPSPEMTTVPIFDQHNTTVRGQRDAQTNTHPFGTLVGGDKKDVVISVRIYTNFASQFVTKPVVIYGWHQLNGTPIQGLYNGHEETYADYSHGIRFVQMDITVDGQPNTVTNVLEDPNLAGLLSDETTYAGKVLPTPRYTLPDYAPAIMTPPSSQTVNPGADVTFSVYAIGDAPLAYQWKLNGANIAGATSSALTLTGVQAVNAGNYTVTVNNGSGSATSLPGTLTINSTGYPILFADNFETNSSANWNVYQGSGNGVPDYTVDWAFNYGVIRYTFNGKPYLIPPSPNSSGTTRGVKLTVNQNDATGATSGVNLYPGSFSASGNFALKFDVWMNYPGGAGGINSTGSTEYAICGINHTGTRVNWAAASASATDGIWFGVDGEGGTSRDYRAYVGNLSGVQTELIGPAASGLAESNNTAGIYPTLFPASRFESSGAPGKRWVSGEVSQVDGVITWKLDGAVVAQRNNTSSFTSGSVMIGYMDIFTSLANPKEDTFVIFDNVRVVNLSSPIVPPGITTQPQSQTVTVGANVTFSVVASGTAPLSYQWRKDGANISGATTSSYTKSNVQAGDAGNYSVLVSNAAGSVASANAVLTVNGSGTPPAITTQPSGQIVDEGGSVTFSVVATGTAPLTYQWRKNAANISGATASSYTKSNVQASDAGNYSVVVANGFGSVTSSDAVLIVNTPPTIITQPQSQTVAPGANATFTVVASGTAPLFYQWRRNGLDISSATASSYTRSGVQSADTGIYTVAINNSVGSVASADAALSITGVTVFGDDFETGTLANWTVLLGTTALAISTAQNHTAGGANSAIVSSSLNKMYHNLGAEVEGQVRATFWIYDNNGAQNRVYGEVRSYSGAGYLNGTLQQLFAIGRYGVPFGPGTGTLASEVVNTAKYQGRVVAGANTGWFNLNTARTVGWHKFEIERAADGSTINFYVDGALDRAITSATFATWDSATMGSVGATGTTGDAWFDDIKVEYLATPVITTQPQSQTVSAGANVTFSVTATGNVQSYQWRKNGVNITGATSSSLVLNNVQASDEGSYTVVISNGAGPTTSTAAVLTVN